MTTTPDAALQRARGPAAVAVAAALAAAALYGSGLHVLPVGDDWLVITWALQHGFDIDYPVRHFRLWERLISAFTFDVLQSTGAASLALSVVFLLAIAAVLAAAARTLAPAAAWAPAVATGLYLFHPANSGAVAQIDTTAQLHVTLLAVLSAWVLVFRAVRPGAAAMVTAFGLALATLFAKETALGVVAWLPIAAYAHARWVEGAPAPGRRAAGILAGVIAAVVAYFWIRAAIGVPLTSHSTERYSVHIDPLLWIRNGALLAGATLYYGDSASWMVRGLAPVVLAGALFSLLLAAAALWGAVTARRGGPTAGNLDWGSLLIWLSFAPAAMVPAVFLGSVSELYVAGITPYFALAAGAALAAGMQRLSANPRPLAALLVVTVAWGALCVQQKLALHGRLSDTVWAAVRALDAPLQACLPDRTDWRVEANLQDTSSGGRPYSVYSATHERTLRQVLAGLGDPFRAAWLRRFAGRPSATEVPVSCTAAPGVEPAACEVACSIAPHAGSRISACRLRDGPCHTGAAG